MDLDQGCFADYLCDVLVNMSTHQVTPIAVSLYPSIYIFFMVFKTQPPVNTKPSDHVGKPLCPGHPSQGDIFKHLAYFLVQFLVEVQPDHPLNS